MVGLWPEWRVKARGRDLFNIERKGRVECSEHQATNG